jgi:prevent-host-death family protein
MTQYSTSDLSRKSGDIIAEALRRPVTITQRNKPRLVLLSIEDYRRLTAKGDTRKAGRLETMPDDLFGDFREALTAYERDGEHHGRKLEDAPRLNAAGEQRPARGRPMSKREVDELVLGTTNAPYTRSITAAALAKSLASGKCGQWKVHIATFFTDVKPELIFEFAEVHGISRRVLASTYRALKAATGEGNPALEAILRQLAPTT